MYLIKSFWSCDLEKKCEYAFLVPKGLILETIRAKAKRTKILDHQIFERTFSCLVMWPWKKCWFCVFGEKGLISETVTARAKRTKFWDHPKKKTEPFIFGHATFKKVPILHFCHLTLKKCNFCRKKMFILETVSARANRYIYGV